MKKKGIRWAAAGLAALLSVTSGGIQTLAADTEETNPKISSPILITEVVPNTDNLNGADAYEYFEVTNISSSDVDMDNYDIIYINGSKQTIWTPDNCVVPADSSILVWIKNAGNIEAIGEYTEPESPENPETQEETPDTPEITAEGAPVLAITELLPDSSNLGGSDAYEFIEICNNSDSTINLKDYRLYYVYPDTGVNTLWWETDDKELEAGGTLVFWIKNGPNNELTTADFNQKFGTDLTDDQLIQLFNGGMANSGRRGLRICTNVGDTVDSVIYNDNGADNTNADKSITCQSQYIDGEFTTVMTSDTATPTPGILTDTEKPVSPAVLQQPSGQPALTDGTAETFDNETESFTFTLEAVPAGACVKTVALYLKYNAQESYERYNLTHSGENNFEKTLNNIDLLNKKSYTYYFEVSDGFSVVTTEEKTVYNTDVSVLGSLNLKDGDMITDSQQVIAYGSRLLIDGTDISDQTVKSINGCGKIAFEATDTDVFFKNAVAVDGDVVGIFNEGTYDTVATYVYDINAEKFDVNSKTITVEFHAGNKANVLEHNIENNDDFTIRNIRMVLPNGRTLIPVSYRAKKGLGAVEHENMDNVPMVDVAVATQQSDIFMGDGTSKYEIFYVTFRMEDSDFEAVRYLWNTTDVTDGEHIISNGSEQVTVKVDNTPPEITTNMEDGKEYHSGTIEVNAADAISENVTSVVLLDGKTISVPYEFRALEMRAGEHVLKIAARDEVGNSSEKEIHFTTPKESADIDAEVSPENGADVKGNPTLFVKAADPSNDEMTVTFKKGERYELEDSNITIDSGVSNQSGSIEKAFEQSTGNGFPYDSFQIALDDTVSEDTVISVKWSGTSNNAKTFMYVYNVVSGIWEKLAAEQTTDGENMTLTGEVILKDHLADGSVRVIVQNGEGYTPEQYPDEAAEIAAFGINVTPNAETANENDTPRSEYDFTFAVESDTQYYNEDYEGNQDKDVDGVYQHQLNIHNWLLGNRERMNIQYLFHDGDIIDDEPNTTEWEQADAAYKMLDAAGFPYGILAGNHDVGHLNGDYTNYVQYFGESRYSSNAWYGGSYKDNRGHYDLITVGGIDFIMVYMGWGVGDEEIAWMNEVLAQYPERKAILNFHEYLLASGGLGEEPQRIHDEVVAVNENVCMVLSGHYHNAKTTIDTFTNADGTERKVYNMLFDYQGLIEGGAGYMRLMHFDLDDGNGNGRIIIRTFSPSHGGTELDNYGDYDAKPSAEPNIGNEYSIEGANLNDDESFEITFADLGIVPQAKTLETIGLDVNVYKSDVIGTVENVESNTPAVYEWKDAEEGINGWYAEITDENGGLSRTNVYYVNVQRDADEPGDENPDDPLLELPYEDVKEGDWFYDYVYDVYVKELMTGLETTVFGPGNNLVRAQFAVILYRMEGEPEVIFEDRFPDVKDGHFYSDAVIWAAQNQIVTGYTDTGLFGPNDPITREQMAVMMFRYANYEGQNTSERKSLASFPDDENVQAYAVEALEWCVAKEIITGKGEEKALEPQGSTYRAECATIISRYTENVE